MHTRVDSFFTIIIILLSCLCESAQCLTPEARGGWRTMKGAWLVTGAPLSRSGVGRPLWSALGAVLSDTVCVCQCVFCDCDGTHSVQLHGKQKGPSSYIPHPLIQKVRVLTLISPLVHIMFSNCHAEQPSPLWWICCFLTCAYGARGANWEDLWCASIWSPLMWPESVNGHTLSSIIIALSTSAICQRWHCSVTAQQVLQHLLQKDYKDPGIKRLMMQHWAVIRSAGCCQKNREEKRKTSRPEERISLKRATEYCVGLLSVHHKDMTARPAIILQRLSLPRALIVNLFCSEMDFPQISYTLIFGLFKTSESRG